MNTVNWLAAAGEPDLDPAARSRGPRITLTGEPAGAASAGLDSAHHPRLILLGGVVHLVAEAIDARPAVADRAARHRHPARLVRLSRFDEAGRQRTGRRRTRSSPSRPTRSKRSRSSPSRASGPACRSPATNGRSSRRPARQPDANEISGVADANLSSLEMERVVDENPPDLKEYGLAQPRIEVTFKSGGQEHTLLIGQKTPPGTDLYAKRAGDNEGLPHPRRISSRPSTRRPSICATRR